ncbi:phytase [Cellvibrio sp. ARAG 10.3]|uniref:phytase n=1 Tax=Cellvibrio sp. ARAG 10.3 TaxID=3451358 RepID=UPI003F459B6D
MPSSSYLSSKLGTVILKSICTLCLGVSVVATAATAPHELSVRYPGAYVDFIPAAEQQKPHWLVVSPEQGIVLLNESLQPRATLDINAELLDTRAQLTSSGLVFATIVEPGHVPTLFSVDVASAKISKVMQLPVPGFQVENLCLQRDTANNLYVYLLDERGIAEHWLMLDGRGTALARHMRNLPIPPNSKACSVDDASASLYIAEEGIGLWHYGASAESAPGRRIIDLRAPFGGLAGGTESVVTLPGGLATVSLEDKTLHTYHINGKKIIAGPKLELSALEEPERIAGWYDSATGDATIWVYDDADGKHYPVTLPWAAPQKKLSASPMPTVKAEIQTAPMSRFGDAADDPAIWIHSKKAQRSLVLGTNKKQGLMVYDLEGREVQSIPSGNVNNVDVRYGLRLGKKLVDVAIASLRDDNSLAIYTIDRRNGKVTEAGKIPTTMEDIYGLCMYQPITDDKKSFGAIYAIVNDKSGEFQQFLISANGEAIEGNLVRTFRVESQPEGCVANDRTRELFVGEEDVAVWTIGADPDDGTQLREVIRAGDVVVDDIEGLAIYHGQQQDYLVVSSQGNDSYVVLDAFAPYAVRGNFRIDLNAEKNIDGVSETDGLEVTHHHLGTGFSEGMLVVQDGHKVMPETPQNFKYVSWKQIREALDLEP